MPSLATGLRLGPYEIISALGAGGMGEVWKARDTRVDRIVAIKRSQQEFSGRFEREARAIAALNHPNICSLFDIGPDYLVMEYVNGEPIKTVQNTRKLLNLAVQIADGLSAAHAAGIVHRDLKPANVLVTRDERVKILDFGLAKLTGGVLFDADATQPADATTPGTVMGTVAYMSPEQARGLPLDARSDQFSFGVILYELASGKRPFQRDTAPQTMSAIIEAEPEPLPQAMPAPLRWIIERCLAKDASARFESTRDLYRDLSSLRDHLSEISIPIAKQERAKRRWIGPVAVAVAGILLIGTAYQLGTKRSPKAEDHITVALTTSGGVVQNPSFSPDASQVVFSWNGPRQSNFNLYVRLIGSNGLLRLTNNSANESSPAWSPDGKQIAFMRELGNNRCAVMLTSPIGGSERTLTDVFCGGFSAYSHSRLTWTPDGRYLAAPDATTGEATGSGLDLISVDTAERRPLTRKRQGEAAGRVDVDPAFSPSGDRLAFVASILYQSRVMWMPLAAGYEPSGSVSEVHTPAPLNFSPLWTNDGQLLISAGNLGTMGFYKVSLTPSSSSSTAIAGAFTDGGAAYSQKTGSVAYPFLQRFDNLYRLPVSMAGHADGPPERITSTTGEDWLGHFSRDGKLIAFLSSRFGEMGIWTVSTATLADNALTSSSHAGFGLGDWAMDGRSVVYFGTSPAGVYQLYRVATDTGRVTRLTDENADDFFPNHSRDGKWIYFSSTRSGKTALYKMPSGGGPATLVVNREVTNAQESPDGRWLYFGDWIVGQALWRMPVAGGEVSRVIERASDPNGYALTNQGIYYWAPNGSRQELRFISLPSREDRLVFQPTTAIHANLSISPDERYLCFPVTEHSSQELMMIENVR